MRVSDCGGPATLTGTLLSVVDPLPSWPLSFEPQQYVPRAVTPQVWLAPALSATKPSPPATSVGLVRCVVVPSPSWPLLFEPQQYAAPAWFEVKLPEAQAQSRQRSWTAALVSFPAMGSPRNWRRSGACTSSWIPPTLSLLPCNRLSGDDHCRLCKEGPPAANLSQRKCATLSPAANGCLFLLGPAKAAASSDAQQGATLSCFLATRM